MTVVRRPISIGIAVLAAFAASALYGVWRTRRLASYKANNARVTNFEAGRCRSKGLVAHWKFDEATSFGTPDSSPAANHGRFELAPGAGVLEKPPRLVEGRVGKALELGQKQWVIGGNNDCFASEQITVAAWVWQKDESGTVPTIAAKSGFPFDGWWLCSTSTRIQGHERFIDLGIAWGSGYSHVNSGYQLPLREWHHIAASLDNAAHEAQFFVDGKPFGEKHVGISSWLINWDHELFVGEYDGTGRWPWKGKLDDVRIYNRILSAQEVEAIYSSS
jgi:hypothetical protein